MKSEYTLSFASQSGKLKILLLFNNRVMKTKTMPIMATTEQLNHPDPALENMLITLRKRWNDLVISFYTGGQSPVKLMFPSRNSDDKTPIQFFSSFHDYRLNRWLTYIDASLQWSDITDDFLCDYHAFLDNEDIATNTIKCYLAGLKKALDDAKRRGYKIPSLDYPDILKGKSAKSISIYLSVDELRKMEEVELPEALDEVRTKFLIGAYTGARYSDFSKLTSADISSGELQYIGEKTGSLVYVPIHCRLAALLGKYKADVSNSRMNKSLPRIGELAGINQVVTVVRGDKKDKSPKWKHIKSHTARRTFATLVYLSGQYDIRSVSKFLGHSSLTTTEKYISCGMYKADRKKFDYFN